MNNNIKNNINNNNIKSNMNNNMYNHINSNINSNINIKNRRFDGNSRPSMRTNNNFMRSSKKKKRKSLFTTVRGDDPNATRFHKKFDPMHTERVRGALKGIEIVTVCALETERELYQPDRKYSKPPTQRNSNIPMTLYYCAALSVLHVIFFLSEHVPEA